MTWKEFKTKVDEALAASGASEDIDILYVDFNEEPEQDVDVTPIGLVIQ